MTKDEEMVAWKIMDLWGADDTRFSRKEIALIVGLSEKEVQRYIDLVKEERLEVYQKYADRRDHVDRQNKFEKRMDKYNNGVLDESLSSERMDYDTPMSSNNKSQRIREHNRKNKDTFGNKNEFEDSL